MVSSPDKKQIAKQVSELIKEAAIKGLMFPRTRDGIHKALLKGDGHAIVFHGIVMAYAECHENGEYHTIHSVRSREGRKGERHGIGVMTNRLKECWRRNPKKPVILACSPDKIGWYQRFGFAVQPKTDAPECVRGGRTEAAWIVCDRVWMMCTISSYSKQKEIGLMAKPNAFVKISGNLLENPSVLDWLRELAKVYFVAVCIGGGEQINLAFKENNYPIKFGPLGRITSSLDQRQLARDVLEKNQALVQDLLDDNGINARAIIPVDDIGGVLCHINGDVMILAAYNGYDKLFVLTLQSRVEKKILWLKNLTNVFEAIEKGGLDKIEVVGF